MPTANSKGLEPTLAILSHWPTYFHMFLQTIHLHTNCIESRCHIFFVAIITPPDVCFSSLTSVELHASAATFFFFWKKNFACAFRTWSATFPLRLCTVPTDTSSSAPFLQEGSFFDAPRWHKALVIWICLLHWWQATAVAAGLHPSQDHHPKCHPSARVASPWVRVGDGTGFAAAGPIAPGFSSSFRTFALRRATPFSQTARSHSEGARDVLLHTARITYTSPFFCAVQTHDFVLDDLHLLFNIQHLSCVTFQVVLGMLQGFFACLWWFAARHCLCFWASRSVLLEPTCRIFASTGKSSSCSWSSEILNLPLEPCHCQFFDFMSQTSNPSTCFYSVINERLFYRKAFLSISSVVSIKTSSNARAWAFPSLLPANLTGMEFVLLLGAPFSALLSVLPFPCASCQVAPQVDNARPLCPCFKRSKTTRTAQSRVPPKLAWWTRTTTTGSFRLLSCPDIWCLAKTAEPFFSIDDKSFVQNCCVPRFARHETLILPRHVTVMHPDDEHVLRESVGEPTHTRSSKEYTQRNTTVIVETHKPKQTQPKLTHRRLLLQPFCSTWKVFAPKVSAVLQRLLRDRHKSQRSVPSASSHLVRPSVFAPHVYTTFQRDLRSALSLDSIMFTCVETRSPCLSGVFPEDSSHRQSGIVQVSDITGRPRNNFPSKIGLVASASPFVLEIFSWKLCRLPLVLSSLFPSVVFRLHSSSVQCGLCSILQLPTPPRHSSLSFLFYLSFFQ